MNSIKTIVTMILMMCMFAFGTGCSDSGMVENIGEIEAALTPCSITGTSGVGTFPQATWITAVRIADGFDGTKLRIDSYDLNTGVTTVASHNFGDVHWAPVNSDHWWAQDVSLPLRRVVTRAPGCQLSSPTKWCMDFQGDYIFDGVHLNKLQNGTRFLSDVPISIGDIETPVGSGIAQITGYGSYNWQMRYPNASSSAMSTKNWAFNAAACQ